MSSNSIALAWAALLLLAGSSPAFAGPRASSLSWVRLAGAESCAAAPELAQAVEGLLGRPVFVPLAVAELAVEGWAEALPQESPNRWRAVIRVTERGGVVLGDRVVESAAVGCEELGRVAATAIALMIDPVDSTPPAEPEVATPARWAFELQTSAFVGAGMVPGVSVGGMGTVVLKPPRALAVLAWGGVVPFSRLADPGVQADFLRAEGGLQACPLELDRAAVSFRACLGVDLGAILVLGSTPELDATEKILAQAHGALRLRVRTNGPLTVVVAIHPLVPLRRVGFSVLDADPPGTNAEVYTQPPVAGFVELGLGLHFDPS